MNPRFSVSLQKIINEMNLKTLYAAEDPCKILISSMDVNRPGLQLTGFLDRFDNERIQVMGLTEESYLKQFSDEQVAQAAENYLALKPPVLIFTREIQPPPQIMEAARRHGVTVLGTDEATSTF